MYKYSRCKIIAIHPPRKPGHARKMFPGKYYYAQIAPSNPEGRRSNP